MEKEQWNPGALLAPVPAVLVSCGSMEHPNVMTAAWTGIVCTKPAMTYVSLRPERYSYHLIEESGEFVLNLTTASLVKATDFCGVRSGRDTDKFSLCGLTPVECPQVSCPGVGESPVNIACKVTQKIALGSHDLFLARIVGVQVDKSLVNRQGKLQLDRCGLLAYAHGEYFSLGEKLGSFGYSVRKKQPAGKKPSRTQAAGTVGTGSDRTSEQARPVGTSSSAASGAPDRKRRGGKAHGKGKR